MATPDFGKGIMIDGVASETIANSLFAAGVAEQSVMSLLGHLYLGYAGGSTPQAFRFKTEVEDHDPRCDPFFERTFELGSGGTFELDTVRGR